MYRDKRAESIWQIPCTLILCALVSPCLWAQTEATAINTAPDDQVMSPPDALIETPSEPPSSRPSEPDSDPEIPILQQNEQVSAAEVTGPALPDRELPSPKQSVGWGEMAFPLIKTVGGAGVVLSLIFAVFLLIKKIAPQYFAKRSREKALRLMDTLPMGEKRSIAVVQIYGNNYLIGNTPNQISLLATLDAPSSAVSREMERPGGAEPVTRKSSGKTDGFLELYKNERGAPVRKSGGPSLIPPDIRGKMRELRQALEG